MKNGTVIPHIKLAQSIKNMDWTKLSLQVFADDKTTTASGLVYLPEGTAVEKVTVNKKRTAFEVAPNALNGKTTFKVEVSK